ncbi:ArsR/SmtB family transcription factor [Bacillus massilinigeriensis]|uniref:ArsR/SmtB family transcription factor n=1 Tax=Bacillus massilionigeriensis TaxID=1805475 RepID=UPI00096B06E2|nr:metalloregulator ArsR/SmtB family transcription factor [Bacillus massilionigeriensis]
MKRNDTCEVYCFDEEKVNRLQGMLKKVDMAKMALIFKALADENRAKIVFALCQDKELCVCDIANIIGSTVATASHHLRTLHKQGIVSFRKEGKMAFYSIDDKYIMQLVHIALHQQGGELQCLSRK